MKTAPIKCGKYVNDDGQIVTVVRVFGRGRNRQVKLAEPRDEVASFNVGRMYMKVSRFRRLYAPAEQ